MSKSAGEAQTPESRSDLSFKAQSSSDLSFSCRTNVEAASSQNEHELRSFTRNKSIFQVDEGHRSPNTAYKYRIDFGRFLDFIKIHDLDVLLDLGKEAIQELVIRYTKSLRDDPVKKYSRGTVNCRISAILYFLDNNDIELNRRKIRRYYPSDESSNDDRPYSMQEIEQIISVCGDLRSKAMILLMASTGIRIGALHSLRIGDLTKLTNFQNQNFGFRNPEIYKVFVYARTRDKYYTFTTPEAAKVIDSYLESRVRCGEQLKDESPLFRKGFNKADPFTINVPKFLSAGGVTRSFDELIKRSGVNTSECMRSHAFRKGFKIICDQSGMKSINVEMLLGHDIGVSGRYYRPNESDILEDFMTHAADALTIDPTKKLQQKVQELESERSKELEVMKTQLLEYKKFADKTAAEISELKTRKDLHGWSSSLYFVDPNFSNLVDAVNDLRAKNGLEPVVNTTTTVTARESKAVKEKRIREELRQLTELRRENEHPDYEETKAERIKELQQELKECLL